MGVMSAEAAHAQARAMYERARAAEVERLAAMPSREHRAAYLRRIAGKRGRAAADDLVRRLREYAEVRGLVESARKGGL